LDENKRKEKYHFRQNAERGSSFRFFVLLDRIFYLKLLIRGRKRRTKKEGLPQNKKGVSQFAALPKIL